jgi:hypothetical protein
VGVPSETLQTPLSRDNVWRRSIQPKLAAAGLGWASFQVMRREGSIDSWLLIKFEGER